MLVDCLEGFDLGFQFPDAVMEDADVVDFVEGHDGKTLRGALDGLELLVDFVEDFLADVLEDWFAHFFFG
jgi:hypothetical protein